MSLAVDTGITSVRDQVSDAEWKVRVELAATYRLVAHYGWSDLIYTHISARVPDAENHFLINPYGMTFDEITASSLVKIDLEGNIVMESPYMVNPAGFTIHSAVHGAGDDHHAVIHTHSDDGVAVSAQADGLLPLSQTSMIVREDLAYHDYEGIALNHDERERLIADLGDKHSMILRNHGLLTAGASCADAFLRLFFLERACTMQIKALAGGTKLSIPSQDVQDVVSAQAKFQDSNGMGNLAWPALVRTLDRIDPSYKD
ncbi:MAG: class II aldolase/adducin family protein [Parvibaculaceae bacterium]|nr:class II aldolase/adducin family protein [Parvibaculaceae bacterium]